MRSMSVRWGLITGAASLALWQAPAFAQRDLADLLEEEDAKPGRPVATQPSDGAASDASPLGGENRKAAVPAAAAVKQGRVKVEDVFRRDVLEARTSEAKSSVAMQILKLAGETTPGADQYAMFIVALETAVSAGDFGLVMQVVDGVVANYEVGRSAFEAQCVKTFVDRAPPTALAAALEAIGTLTRKCLSAGQVEAAKEWATFAVSAARRTKDREQQRSAVELLNEVRAREKALEEIQPLVDRLAADPNDREAAAELGRVRCFQEGNWEAGLPLLAKGADMELAVIAKLELEPPTGPADRVKRGDAWWAYAEKHKGDEAAAAETRARDHYVVALGDLAGLEKVRIEKRLGEAAAPRSGAEKRPKSLVLWLDASAPGALRGPGGQPFDRARGAPMPVGAWTDLGAGFTCGVGSGAQAPVVDPKAFGGMPGVVFTGTQWLVGGFKTPQAGTAALVCQFEDMGTFMRVFGCLENDPGIRVSNRTDGALWFELATDFKGGDVAMTPPGAIQGGQQLIIIGTWPNPVAMRLNGRPFVAAKPGAADASRGSAMVVGAMTEKGTYPFKGLIAELRVYDEILPAARITALEAELGAKWSGGRK